MLRSPRFLRPCDFHWWKGYDEHLTVLSDPNVAPYVECIRFLNGTTAQIHAMIRPPNDMPSFRIFWTPFENLSSQDVDLDLSYQWINPTDSLSTGVSGNTYGRTVSTSAYDLEVTEGNLYSTAPGDSDRESHISIVADGLLRISLSISDFPSSGDIGIIGLEVY